MTIKYEAVLVDNITPSLKKIKSETESVKVSLNGLKTALGGLAAAFSIREVANLTSSYTDLQSRLRNATGSTQEAELAFRALSQTARTTYTSIEQTAETFLRNSQALKELGLSTQEQIEVSDALNNALAISGTKGQQAESVMNALSKAFATGKLSGQELNTVIASGGRIAQALADGLGVSTNQLRLMGQAGRLDTTTMIQILRGEMGKLREEAGAMPATIRDGFTLLNNAIFNLLGSFDKITGGSGSVAGLLERLADSINGLTESMNQSASAIKAFYDAIVQLAVIAAVTVGAAKLGGAIAAAGMAATRSRDAFKAFAGAIGLGGVLRSTKDGLGIIKREIIEIPNTFKRAFRPELFKGADTGFRQIFNSLFAVAGGFARLIPIIGLAAGAFSILNSAVKAFRDDGKGITDLAQDLAKAMGLIQETSREAAARIKAAEDAMAKHAEEVRQNSQAHREAAQSVNIFSKEMDDLNRQLEASARNYRESVETQLDNLRVQNQLIGASELQKRLTQELRALDSAYYRESRRLSDELAKARSNAASTDEKEKALATEAIKTLERQQKELNSTYSKTAIAVRDLVVEEQRRLELQKQIQEQFKIDDTIAAYKEQNRLGNENIALETAKLRLSESQKSVVDSLYGLEQQRLNAIKPLQERINELKRSNNEADKEIIPILEQGIAGINEQYGAQVTILNELLAKKEEEVRLNNLVNFSRKQALDTESQIRKVQDDIAKLSMTEIERKYYDIASAARESAIAAIEAEEARRGEKLSASEIENYYRVAREQAEKLKAVTEEHNKKSREWSTGWKKAYKDYADDATNAAKRAESIFKKATQGMEDAIVGFAKTGKFEFKSFMSSILEELLRSQVRQLMAQIFSMNLGGGRSGGDALGSLFGGFFATGGMIPPGRFGVVGEAGPELVQGPAEVSPLGAQQVIYNINAVDARSFKELIASDPGFIHAIAMKGGSGIPSRR